MCLRHICGINGHFTHVVIGVEINVAIASCKMFHLRQVTLSCATDVEASGYSHSRHQRTGTKQKNIDVAESMASDYSYYSVTDINTLGNVYSSDRHRDVRLRICAIPTSRRHATYVFVIHVETSFFVH